MNRGKILAWLVAVIIFAVGCSRQQSITPSKPLNPEQKKVVRKLSISKVSDRGNVTRELEFHAEGGKFTTTCRSANNEAVALAAVCATLSFSSRQVEQTFRGGL
jgi:hypothetical protein